MKKIMVSLLLVCLLTSLTVHAEGEEWQFTFFGTNVGKDRNVLISSGIGIEEPVSLGSALFNEDGSVKKKGGKFVADSPADGGSYYYTTIDPAKENFVLKADITVDAINPTPDGQEGFALMVRDKMFAKGETGSRMANLVSVCGTKLPTGGVNVGDEVKDTIGIRAYSGIRTEEASDENNTRVTRYGWYRDGDGNPGLIKQGETYRLRLEKTDYAYIASQYAIKEDGSDGELLGSYTYFIPAEDETKKTVGSYDELDDPMTYQEEDKAYVGLVVARGLNGTFKNISFSKSQWNAEGWRPQDTEYVDPEYSIKSPSTCGGDQYELSFIANADGKADVYRDGVSLDKNVRITAKALWSGKYEMPTDEAVFTVRFTPDEDYHISTFRMLNSYETKDLTVSVVRRNLGKDDIIYVKPDGKPENGGTSYDDAVDVQTAFDYSKPGDTILLTSDVYEFTEGISINRGRNGTEEAPIVLTTVDGKFATFDFKGVGAGFNASGNYWKMSFINVTNSADWKSGLDLFGSHNTLERMNFYNNGSTGLAVTTFSNPTTEMLPAYNRIIKCTSMNNADSALEDADGFGPKIKVGEGNVFEECIAAYNADDGWDLFAKITPGQIGKVTINNCIAYKNGIIMVKEGSSRTGFTLAEVFCDDNGNLSFGEGVEMEAGNGNGFKMGGSNLPGDHVLMNSYSYENKAKGIDSNSCSDIKVENSISYNNGGANVAFYTENKNAATDFGAHKVISYRKGDTTEVSENIRLQDQDEAAVYGTDNYYWDPEAKTSRNTEGETVTDDWFVSLDTSLVPTRNPDGTIDRHGLLDLVSGQSQPDDETDVPGDDTTDPSPETGEGTDPLIYASVMVLSSLAAVVLIKKSKRA